MGVAISPVIAGPLPRRNIDGTFTSEMPCFGQHRSLESSFCVFGGLFPSTLCFGHFAHGRGGYIAPFSFYPRGWKRFAQRFLAALDSGGHGGLTPFVRVASRRLQAKLIVVVVSHYTEQHTSPLE